jgi:hypothetical protein
MMRTINFGDVLICAETGKTFVAARDGITTNYARDDHGNVFSDEGVNIRERRELLDRTRPFVCYLSSDGKHVTGWKGNVLGDVTCSRTIPLTRVSFTHGRTIQSVRVRDVHGGYWYGRGNAGIAIKLFPYKTKVTP